MTADIEEHDLPFGDEEHEDRAIGVVKTDGMTAGEFAGQGMEPEAGPKGVVLQIVEHFAKASFQIGMFPEKLPRLPQKLFGGRQGEHESDSSASNAASNSSAVAKWRARPSLTSSNAVRTRAR